MTPQSHGELAQVTVLSVCKWKANNIGEELPTEVVAVDDRKLQVTLSCVPGSMQILSVSKTTNINQ